MGPQFLFMATMTCLIFIFQTSPLPHGKKKNSLTVLKNKIMASVLIFSMGHETSVCVKMHLTHYHTILAFNDPVKEGF